MLMQSTLYMYASVTWCRLLHISLSKSVDCCAMHDMPDTCQNREVVPLMVNLNCIVVLSSGNN